MIEPTALAYEQQQYGELLQIKKKQPQLKCQADKTEWMKNLGKVMHVRANSTIGNMLDLLMETKIPRLPSKIEEAEKRYQQLTSKANDALEESESKFIKKLSKLRSVKYSEVSNLSEYIDAKTPFSTKHGVKGAEFDNVLVVCGRGWNKYNWNQMLEWMDGSWTKDKQDAYERSRNLFYVSCSRAKHNLTLLFTQELTTKSTSVLEQIFSKENVLGNPLEV